MNSIENPTVGEKSPTVYKYFGVDVELGSHIVVLNQVEKFNLLPKEPQAQYLRDSIVRNIGSEWRKGTRDVIRGLTPQEEEMYLSKIIGISPNSEEWNEKTQEFWADFKVAVPTDKPLQLEIGFTKDGNKVVPINLNDYMKYNFAKLSSKVAWRKDQVINKATYDFYMEDLREIKQRDISEYETRNVNEKAKIDYLLNLLGTQFIGKMTDADKEMALEKIKDDDNKAFLEAISDINLEAKSLLAEAVKYGIIVVTGNSYWYDNLLLGDNYEETLGYLLAKEPEKAKTKQVIQFKIKEYRK
jgi:hypothetical protein